MLQILCSLGMPAHAAMSLGNLWQPVLKRKNLCMQRRDTGRYRSDLACCSSGLATHVAYVHNLASSDGHVLRRLGQISSSSQTASVRFLSISDNAELSIWELVITPYIKLTSKRTNGKFCYKIALILFICLFLSLESDMPPLILGMPFNDPSVFSHHWVSGLPAVHFHYSKNILMILQCSEQQQN